MKILERILMTGPGRRSNRTVLEQLLEFEEPELERIENDSDGSRTRLLNRLRESDLVLDEGRFSVTGAADPSAILCRWYAEIILLLQQSAGHRVAFADHVPGKAPRTARAITEFEESTVAIEAADLALELLGGAVQADLQDFDSAAQFAKLESFRFMARELVLPLDSEALIEAARELDVPCFKLDREPYAGVTGEFRIRKNGLLMLGHACYQHIVDGTFCIDRSASMLASARDYLPAIKLLRAHGLPSRELTR